MLKDIHSPADIRGLSTDELKGLAGEIRRELIDVVSETAAIWRATWARWS